MKRNTKLAISIIGIILVSLTFIGVTYAFFITRVNGNTQEKSIVVSNGIMEVLYTDLSKEETTAIIVPGYETVKYFTVENTGNIDAPYYIYLDDVENNFVRTEDVVYTLYRIEGNNTTDVSNLNIKNFTDEDIVSEGEFPTKTTKLLSETIPAKTKETDPNTMYIYALKIEYIYLDDVNQNEDQGHTIGGNIEIRNVDSIFAERTLVDAIMNDERILKNEGVPNFSTSATTEEGLYSTQDDYGISWYFRGAQSYNYVNFAGFTWRIVRINGDNSVRLILEGNIDKVTRKGETTVAGIDTIFNYEKETNGDNAYVGYMYGLTETNDNVCLIKSNGITTKTDLDETNCASSGGIWTSPYDATHMNLNDSNAKETLDLFYKTYIENTEKNYRYSEYLADTIFCGDKTLASDTQKGYGQVSTDYSSSIRIFRYNPTLQCALNAKNAYSRYTVNALTTSKGVVTNGDLNYPIGLISADEVMFAGATLESNTSFYLYDSVKSTFMMTMTPASSHSNTDGANIWALVPESMGLYMDYSVQGVNSIYGVRPVINLRNDVIIVSGDGTKDTTVGAGPYTIKLG